VDEVAPTPWQRFRRRRPPEHAHGRGYGLLLVFIIGMFLMSGLGGKAGSILTSSLGLAIVLSARFTSPIGLGRLERVVITVLAAAAPLATALTDPSDPARSVPYFAQVVVLGVIVIGLILRVLRRPVVDMQTLYGAVAIYFLIGLAFAWTYVGLNVWDDGQFSIDSDEEAEFFEFSFVVLTTLGFGNEVPTAPLSGRIVVLEAVLGQVFLATFLARLVSMFGRQRHTAGPDDPSGV
jgi:hypothetical protein